MSRSGRASEIGSVRRAWRRCCVIAAAAVLLGTGCRPAASETTAPSSEPATARPAEAADMNRQPALEADPSIASATEPARMTEQDAQAVAIQKIEPTETQVEEETERPRPLPPPKLPPPAGARRLSPDYDVWIDSKAGTVIIDGQISLREGMLEMFACLRNTKEHESIVSANTRAFIVHAALLSLGAEPGTPVQFMPEFKPPSGTEIEILVQWIDEEGNEETAPAQELIKDIRTGKAMVHPFVFAGSLFSVDPETGERHYMAEGGDFICVSNFGTAMLDVPVESSPSNEALAFVAFTERIPPLGAPVRLILKPKLKPDDGARGSRRRAPPGERGAARGERGAIDSERGESPTGR